MKRLWLLYNDPDYAVNLEFARMMRERGKACSLSIEPVLLSELDLGMDRSGTPFCLRNGRPARPDAVLSRQRSSLVSAHLESMGIPVFNNSRVCALCNDKRQTYQFLRGLPMPESRFLLPGQSCPPEGTRFPVIVKPALSHGGDRVALVRDETQWREAAACILPEPALQQAVVSRAGYDLRVYVLFGEILTGVLRTAKTGVVSNFKLGGEVALHPPVQEERDLAQAVIRRFEEAGAPLCMAGVDLLYDDGHPVVGEVEDVVGSRMLYQTSHVDIAALYVEGIAKRLGNGQITKSVV